jgi:7,8-dihydroneopterin aldolase/epimerase/oxygenase
VSVVVELRGLELPGRHGAEPEERERPQPFLYDVRLSLPEPDRDELAATVDYREVVSLIRELLDGTSFHLLESLAGAVAEALLQRFPADYVEVRVRKPEVQLGVPVDYTAASVRLERR